MVIDVLDGLYFFITILKPKGSQKLDQYCTGMVFGLEGSKLLVKVANTLINPIDSSSGKAKKTFGKKKDGLAGTFRNIAEGIMNTAANSMGGGQNDELWKGSIST